MQKGVSAAVAMVHEEKLVTFVTTSNNDNNHEDTLHCSCDPMWLPDASTERLDLVISIRAIIKHLPISIHAVEVMGHLDKHMQYEDFPFLNKLNFHMDEVAKAMLRDAIINDIPAPSNQDPLPGEGWTVHLHGHKKPLLAVRHKLT